MDCHHFDPGNFDPGNFDPGNFDPGNFDPGNFDPGNVDPGNVDPGNFVPGTGVSRNCACGRRGIQQSSRARRTDLRAMVISFCTVVLVYSVAGTGNAVFASGQQLRQASATLEQESDSQRANVAGFVATLQEFGIEPTPESIREWLRQVVPDDDIEARILPLIQQLSHQEFGVRNRATVRLKQMPQLSADVLRQLESRYTQPETRMRMRMVIDYLEQPNRARLQYAIFRFVAKQPVLDVADLIIKAWPHLVDKPHVRHAASQALAGTAVVTDAGKLSSLVKDTERDSLLRLGALRALNRIDADLATDLLPDLNPQTGGNLGLEIARQYATRSDQRTFAILIDLTMDPDRRVSSRAWSALRRLTETKISFSELTSSATRDESIGKLKKLIAGIDDQTVLDWDSRSPRLGRTLIADYENGHVYEIDDSGNVQWKFETEYPFAVFGTSQGSRLVATYQDSKIIEFDANGNKVLTIDNLDSGPTGICRLENGNTVVAYGQTSTGLAVFDNQGTLLREIPIDGGPSSVEILDNGNFLIALYQANAIAEVSPDGTEMWKLPVNSQPYHATRLDNGNTLVTTCTEATVREYAPDGTVVWEHKCGTSPFRAHRQEDGTTLVADADGVHIVDPDGNSVQLAEDLNLGDYLFIHSF